MSRILNLVAEDEAVRVIDELKGRFGVKEDAEVLRKSLAVAKFASEHTDSEGTLTVLGADGSQHKLSITT
jgi:predicted transcriptional regulator